MILSTIRFGGYPIKFRYQTKSSCQWQRLTGSELHPFRENFSALEWSISEITGNTHPKNALNPCHRSDTFITSFLWRLTVDLHEKRITSEESLGTTEIACSKRSSWGKHTQTHISWNKQVSKTSDIHARKPTQSSPSYITIDINIW
jgi:uncharacterized protein YkwD